MGMKQKIITICGPTGIGKTHLAIHLAQAFDGEIIGADSMQIYKYMDIGTAKPDADECRMASHHLIDFVEPDQSFDAGQYIRHADAAITALVNREKLPIVAGGTGFYIKALLHGLFRERTADRQVLERLERELKSRGAKALHDRLVQMDSEAAKRIYPNDTFRVIRALEVIEATGKSISSHQQSHGFSEERYDTLTFGLYMERSLLYERIDRRVDLMITQGFVDEVKALLERGYSCDLKSMQSIGYRHICDYLKGNLPWDETIRLMKRDTRRYAKRQFTWFRSQKNMIWLEPSETKKAEQRVSEFLLKSSG